MDDRIKNLYEWDVKRKERLNEQIKSKEKNIKINMKKKPKIDKYSYKITVNRKPDEIFKRLYKDDVIKRKERRELLQQIYTPSFRPNIADKKKTRKKSQSKYSNINNSINNINSSHLIENGSSKYLFSVKSSKTNIMKESDTDENEFDDDIIKNEYLYNYDDKEINNIIRTHVFSKISDKKRYNTSMNLEIRRKESDDDDNNEENEEENNDEENNDEENNDEENNDDNHKEVVNKKEKKVNFNKNGSNGALKRNNNSRIKIKKKYGYLLTESKNRNRSGYL